MLITGVLTDNQSRLNVRTHVWVRPIGFDMGEVGGSNPPGPATQSLISTHFFARWTLRALPDS